MTRHHPRFPGDIGEPPLDPPDTDEDDAAADRARARAILDLVSEELESLPMLDPDDIAQAAKDFGGLVLKVREHRHAGDWGAEEVIDNLRIHLEIHAAVGAFAVPDLVPANALIATLEEAAREPQFSPDFEPGWEDM